MENTDKVFSSEIIRTENPYKNNLYELLNIEPARPLEVKDKKKYTCEFIPKTGKIYIPKARHRVKVKTIRNIRTLFENDTYAYLTGDLESQQNYLLKKIRGGSSQSEGTIKIAKKILNTNKPLSRSIWQMLINLNPNNHVHPRQFVLWNGKCIQVNGSNGGRNKFICNNDLAHIKLPSQPQKKRIKNNIPIKSKGLLRNSLAIKFKPGPLARKKFLDDSYQKYSGDLELVDLPKVGLVIQPTYNTALDSTITQFISKLCKDDGTISEKWAEFAVSVLGKTENSTAKLVTQESMMFDLNYKCDQRRILMRKDLENSNCVPKQTHISAMTENEVKGELSLVNDIKHMMIKLIDAVEININQDKMYDVDEDLNQTIPEKLNTDDTTPISKDRIKRKYCELDRLDVTVIRLPESPKNDTKQDCGNLHCSLGCVCDSLKYTYNVKQHCGREECMFVCKCDFSQYTAIDLYDVDRSDLIPGLINIEDEMNMTMAKEEQKFHQTVIVTRDNNILLKPQKRNWKSSKKYEPFFKNMCMKSVDRRKRELSIQVEKLDCKNIEPWCMVHNLYKCFCKGKFTESASILLQNNAEDASLMGEYLSEKLQNSTDITATPKHLRPRVRQERPCINLGKAYKIQSHSEKSNTCTDKNCEDRSTSECSDYLDYYLLDYNGTCSRVNAYDGRKYSDGHYKNTNYRIKEMEKNDKNLLLRMMSIVKDNPDNEEAISPDSLDCDNSLEKGSARTNAQTKHSEKQNSLKKIQQTENSTSKVGEKTSSRGKEGENLNADNSVDLSDDRNIMNFLCDIDGITPCNDEKINHSDTQKLLSPNESKLVSWLESNYKLYKEQIDQGLIKTSLDRPRVGKVVLHSWDFILGRYRDRKNHFLISKHKPYRIFMGIHTRNPFFESCMNINEIRFAELHKYPQTVKNLLTNASDMKDSFCILRGLAFCWELVGSVTKVSRNDENTEDVSDETSDLESYPQLNRSDVSDEPSFNCTEQIYNISSRSNENESTQKCLDEADSSKWFVMTVENDFSEIRFYKKGFFVKYESIVKAINVARMSGKTVRLSSQKCVDRNSGPQFGVYAIPNATEYCVFIGPYEIKDSLGIETIKTILDVKKTKRTRGFWINTNKVDNLRVIDNPLSFMPPSNTNNKEIVSLENNFSDEYISDHQNSSEKHTPQELDKTENQSLLKVDPKKIVKPIKIRKTNGFYHLAKEGLLKKITLQSPHKASININNSSDHSSDNKLTSESVKTSSTEDLNTEKGRPIKISSVYLQQGALNIDSKKTERSMFILKPEEINRKLFEKQLLISATTPSSSQDTGRSLSEDTLNPEVIDIDVEVPAKSTTSTPNTDIICVISDEEDDFINEKNKNIENCKDILIQCTNVTDLGWVLGKQTLESHLISFKAPGHQYSDFFPKEEAFKKLNAELSRIVGPSKPFKLCWKIVDSVRNVQDELRLIDCKLLNKLYGAKKSPTSMGLLASENVKTYSNKNITSCASSGKMSKE